MRRGGLAILAVVAATALTAPWLAPNEPNARFEQLLFAPPTPIHVWSDGPRAPFIYRWQVVSRLERRFEAERSKPVRLRWFTRSALVTTGSPADAPLLLLGADAYGRDIFSRLLYGARTTLALALVATALATLLGTAVGALSAYSGTTLDLLLSRFTELVLVLPAIYVALAVRAALPLVLSPGAVFTLLAGIFALLGWPIVARGVRAIVLAEREQEYASAARAAGASRLRLVARHLVPAARGYIATQAALLLPAFILAEATLSFVGLGFPDTTPTWGTMLQDATNVALIGDAPWTLAPAAAIFVVVLGTNLLIQGTGRAPVQLEP